MAYIKIIIDIYKQLIKYLHIHLKLDSHINPLKWVNISPKWILSPFYRCVLSDAAGAKPLVATEHLKCGLSELRCAVIVKCILGFKYLVQKIKYKISD